MMRNEALLRLKKTTPPPKTPQTNIEESVDPEKMSQSEGIMD